MTAPNATSDVRPAPPAREAPSRVVYGLYRLVKACTLYDDSNVAVARLTAAATEALHAYGALIGTDTATIVFLGEAVFVGGELLRTSRETHVIAVELGEILARCEVSEVAIGTGIDRGAMRALARAIADGMNDPTASARLKSVEIPGVRLAKVSTARGGARVKGSPVARALRTYAVAVVAVQDLEATPAGDGTTKALRRTKRVAQKLVATLEQDPHALVALTAAAGARDSAGLAVSSAVLAIAMARQLTTDRVLLTNLGMVALLHDAGRARLARSSLSRLGRALGEEELDRLPASAVFVMTTMMKLHAPARVRGVLAYEAQSLARGERLGAVYRGYRKATPLAHVLTFARRFVTLRAAQAAGAGLDEVVDGLVSSARDASERTYLKLLTGALGVFPAGTLVELDTGEKAVVLATPRRPIDFARPAVRIVHDRAGGVLEQPLDIDLARPRLGEPPRFVRRAVNADDAQEKAMRDAIAAVRSRPPAAAASTPPRCAPDVLAPPELDLGPSSRAQRPAAHAATALAPSPSRPAAPAPERFAPIEAASGVRVAPPEPIDSKGENAGVPHARLPVAVDRIENIDRIRAERVRSDRPSQRAATGTPTPTPPYEERLRRAEELAAKRRPPRDAILSRPPSKPAPSRPIPRDDDAVAEPRVAVRPIPRDEPGIAPAPARSSRSPSKPIPRDEDPVPASRPSAKPSTTPVPKRRSTRDRILAAFVQEPAPKKKPDPAAPSDPPPSRRRDPRSE